METVCVSTDVRSDIELHQNAAVTIDCVEKRTIHARSAINSRVFTRNQNSRGSPRGRTKLRYSIYPGCFEKKKRALI